MKLDPLVKIPLKDLRISIIRTKVYAYISYSYQRFAICIYFKRVLCQVFTKGTSEISSPIISITHLFSEIKMVSSMDFGIGSLYILLGYIFLSIFSSFYSHVLLSLWDVHEQILPKHLQQKGILKIWDKCRQKEVEVGNYNIIPSYLQITITLNQTGWLKEVLL